MLLLSLEKVSFSYKPSKPLLREVSLEIHRGEFISLVGSNGSGKTTLVKLALGLTKPVSGRRWLAKGVRLSYVPQGSILDSLIPMSVFDVVLSGRMRPFQSYRPADYQAVWNYLEELDLRSLAQEEFKTLSGGQRQRVLIARALVDDVDLLVLDEPTLHLDQESSYDLQIFLKNLKKGQKSLFLVSHDPELVSALTQRVYCVENGMCYQHSLSHLSKAAHEKSYVLHTHQEG